MSADYCVYQHIFPNGKQYIGMTNNCLRRWKNGEGYVANHEMYADIKKYGWDNIKHNILVDGLSRSEAQQKEKEMIEKYRTREEGYNKAIGGASARSYFSSNLIKMLQYGIHYPAYKEWCEMYLSKADDEDAAIRLNFYDLAIRQHDKFKSTCCNNYICIGIYLCLLRDLIQGIDIWDSDYNPISIQFGGLL